MAPLTSLRDILVLFLVLIPLGEVFASIPRKTVQYDNAKSFRENGISNYSTMTLREDLGVLFIGARDAVYALDLEDISSKKAGVYWQVSEEQNMSCKSKGKDSMECQNYIKTLQTLHDGRMLVCGTNAYNPTCDYMTYANGTLTLEGKKEEGRGKVPFDPFQRSTSVMVGTELYSATAINFLGTEQVLQRHSFPAIRTEHRQSWLNKPFFVQLDVVPESINNLDGDDDKVYMFFSEEAMEFDLPAQIRVSRVARVCKGDLGGQRTLQQKWTSYLKVRLDCPVPLEPSLPAIIQDIFLLKDQDWRKSVFYAVFSPQTTTSDLSTVCAFSVVDIGKVFSEGRYMTPVTMESETRWVTHTGEEPVPRPGTCMTNAVRDLGIVHSLDLPDKTLQFVRDQPLLDGAVPPLTGGPLVLQRGAKLSVIVVDRVMAVDGEIHHVMFIGTEEGTVQKVVQYAAGDTVIIQETRVFQTLEPIKVLRLSSGTLYAGSGSGVVQIPVKDCGRYGSCLDCILARDPYCAWDTTLAACSSVLNLPTGSRNMYQSLKHADASMCPRSVPVKPLTLPFNVGSPIHLPCQPASNLAQVSWHFAKQPLQLRDRYQMLSQDLLIVSALASDAGRYTCQSLEEVKGQLYTRTEAAYILQPTKTLLVLQTSVALLSVLLGVVVLWSVRGHVRLRARIHPAEPGQNNNNNWRTDPGCVPGSEVNNNHTIITIEDMEDNQTARVSVALLSMILGSLMLWNISRDQSSHRVFRMEEGLQDHMSPVNSSSAVIHMGDI
ncbi:semaphorin-4E-like [Oncorhynchus mykiss]|uniref:semaphorin-4E-like n=1 Tax=Oncorhynchus mykiss TaxID=8022 RepID=UPI001878E370|nr:semaphorin-4E-like [Oncorhynchus mykiss]